MDPNAALGAIRELVTDGADGLDEGRAELLRDLVADLDEWITRGGFLPADWQRKA